MRYSKLDLTEPIDALMTDMSVLATIIRYDDGKNALRLKDSVRAVRLRAQKLEKALNEFTKGEK